MATPLKTERLIRQLSAHQVATAVGVQAPTISRIENGRKRSSPELANRLALFFGNKITRDQILFPEDYPMDGRKKPVKSSTSEEI